MVIILRILKKTTFTIAIAVSIPFAVMGFVTAFVSAAFKDGWLLHEVIYEWAVNPLETLHTLIIKIMGEQ